MVTEPSSRKVFKVFQELLVRFAPNFAVYLSSHGNEVGNTSINTFKVFTGWLRSQYIQNQDELEDNPDWRLLGDEPQCNEDGDSLMLDEPAGVIFIAAVNIWIFAKAYDIPDLLKDAIDRLCWCFDSEYCLQDEILLWTDAAAAAIKKVYDNFGPQSAIRRLLVAGFRNNHAELNLKDLQDLPIGFLADVLTAVQEVGKLFPCDFHDHMTVQEQQACLEESSGVVDH
ncbi:hypothetical protein K504DRAFT_492627 [Pleomassaria siparia CBS 279.74]|uniref:BTB domain-containing protein n=1 Tax=Pleomassaria siparia CBS 279.74 TaxID=1314801 RepID=A0A6G1K3H5_9PLEO|nr:hypothetical protein K504DRAFT_492627 [Pleomassaria siparia CBS 279.74]